MIEERLWVILSMVELIIMLMTLMILKHIPTYHHSMSTRPLVTDSKGYESIRICTQCAHHVCEKQCVFNGWQYRPSSTCRCTVHTVDVCVLHACTVLYVYYV